MRTLVLLILLLFTRSAFGQHGAVVDALALGDPQALATGSNVFATLPPLQAEIGGPQTPSHNWWSSITSQPLLGSDNWLSFDLRTLISDSLDQSPRFRGVVQKREIAWAEVVQKDAAFDAQWLFDYRFGRTSDPVGNVLVTGGPDRLREFDWNSEVGLQRLTRWGTQWEVTQKLGLLDSNSQFFRPPNQANSRLTIGMTHPLLAGSGRFYTERLVLEARLNADVTRQEVQEEMQQNLAEIMLAYWRLYSARCRYIQQDALIARGEELRHLVAARSHFDTGHIERLRVDEQMQRRSDRLLRLGTELRNEQSRLAMYVGTAQINQHRYDELIPRDRPNCPVIDLDIESAFITSLNYRPDVAMAAAELEKAALEVKVTRQDLLPRLNALVETYVAGLEGRYDLFQSVGQQFTDGEPGFTAGFVLDFAPGRRAVQARNWAAQAELRRSAARTEETIQRVRAEVEIAARNLMTASRSISNRESALQTAISEENYLAERWKAIGSDGAPVGLLLEDLLNVQQMRTQAESDLVEAQVEYLDALVRLQLAMGTLFTECGETITQETPIASAARDASTIPLGMIDSISEDAAANPAAQGDESVDTLPNAVENFQESDR